MLPFWNVQYSVFNMDCGHFIQRSYEGNIFEAFLRVISSSTNLIFQMSDIYMQQISIIHDDIHYVKFFFFIKAKSIYFVRQKETYKQVNVSDIFRVLPTFTCQSNLQPIQGSQDQSGAVVRILKKYLANKLLRNIQKENDFLLSTKNVRVFFAFITTTRPRFTTPQTKSNQVQFVENWTFSKIRA